MRLSAEDKERSVRISGGTFALCFWLYLLVASVFIVEGKLERIAVALEKIAATK